MHRPVKFQVEKPKRLLESIVFETLRLFSNKKFDSFSCENVSHFLEIHKKIRKIETLAGFLLATLYTLWERP